MWEKKNNLPDCLVYLLARRGDRRTVCRCTACWVGRRLSSYFHFYPEPSTSQAGIGVLPHYKSKCHSYIKYILIHVCVIWFLQTCLIRYNYLRLDVTQFQTGVAWARLYIKWRQRAEKRTNMPTTKPFRVRMHLYMKTTFPYLNYLYQWN